MTLLPQDRKDLVYVAGDGESLKSYIGRLKSGVEAVRFTYAPAHERWYTHRGNAPCWICNMMDCNDYLISLLDDMQKNDKNGHWKCVRPEGQKDPLSFQFQRTKVS